MTDDLTVKYTEGDKYVYTVPGNGYVMQQFVMGKNAFDTRPEAVVAAKKMAKKMAKKKVASLKKQIAAIEALDFSKDSES